MTLYREIVNYEGDGPTRIPQLLPDIEVHIEAIVQLPNFSIWSINHQTSLSILQAIRENPIAGNTTMVPGFRSYLSDPTDGISGGFIITDTLVYFSEKAISLHRNRDSYTTEYGTREHFYTTLSMLDILHIVLKKRALVRAEFIFASEAITNIGEIITLEDLKNRAL